MLFWLDARTVVLVMSGILLAMWQAVGMNFWR